MTVFSSFPNALHADGPAPELAGKLGLYGWLVGDWEMDAHRPLPHGKVARGKGEIHFGWVLGGRAIQDIWHVGAPDGRPAMFGTTLRIYDPGIDAWHIVWIDPLGQNHLRQTGRAEGKDIVQLGTDATGAETRWRFTEISENAFHWIGERRPTGAGDWQLVVEFLARRKAA
jgi:hypothetical protein